MVLLENQPLAESGAWRGYREAFEDFSRSVREVQCLLANPNPDRSGIEAALLELEKARVAYNHRRDEVAEQLLRSSARRAFLDSKDESAAAHAARVRGLAKLLWEVSGRPEGSAEEHWYRAEDILRRAAAA